MGYYTNYTLKIHEGEKNISEVLDEVEYAFEGSYYAIDTDGQSLDGVKWHSHEEDTKELSKQYPNEVFVLHGEGEDADDIWYKYFKDGKMQECYAKITFDEYDENLLR